ncbi:MAG: helix-turn-helix domain-containing protein [Pantoea sp.]|nr:helix-turn-helix domain-containing protein [Pantoea sp.]
MYVATTKQSRNFVKAYHDVLESTEINSNEKLVYLFLLSYQETAAVESIFPSNEYIAQRLGLSVRTVIRATATLAEAGLIAKTRRFNKSNTFEVTNCHVWTCQTVTSGRDKLADYKNRVLDQKEDQLDEEKGQNQDASLSRDDDLHSPNVRIVTDGSDQIMSREEEEKPVVMKAAPVLDDEYVDDELPDSVDDEDYFEPDDNSDFIDDDEVTYHNEQRSEERNQQITKHFSTAPTREEYKRMLSGNRVSQYKHKPAKPAWMQ